VNAGLLSKDDLALRPGGSRAPWLREALEHESSAAPAPPLDRDMRTDVAIVGGGYTGLWTAWHLLDRNPDLSITIVEQDICGGGPSGGNGGFVNSWWDEIGALVDRFGEAGALACARESAASVQAIGAWCAANGVDAHHRRAGMLTVSTALAHDGRVRGDADLAARLGDAAALTDLDAEAVAARCRSPRFRGGSLMRDGATVHPGHLVRGLRAACIARGIRIFEGTRATGLSTEGDGVRVATPDGVLRAGHAVLAVNAWLAGWPQSADRVLAWSSYMVRSEPIGDLVERELGWTGGEAIVDARFSVHYLHVTRDGRIAIGAGGGRPGYRGRIGPSFEADVDAARRAAFAFRWFFPQLREVRLTDAWGGPIDVSSDHLPHVWSTGGGRMHVAAGYSGNGVAPSHLLGRILAARVLGSDEPLTRLPIVGRARLRFPPEPMRSVGARVLRAAMISREDAEEAGRRPGRLVRLATRVPRWLGYPLGPSD
jgi:glycine/D-amino acid oxidase-like deaminating enzyme